MKCKCKTICWVCGHDIDETTAEKLGTQIEKLGLSVRARNCLRRAGIEYVEELLFRLESKDELTTIRNLGAKTQKEIIESVKSFGFDLPQHAAKGGDK